ncbi:MAG: hypothetical protein CVU11_13185 [Bacteroidetes bacterium HGW-Bacteroidetes-6]|jgi:hypothetical protein|nr:MAG: hypothetical protein CVU11_13185 [Bacteroidetes bacterium HGW-Bacteroidetes-6]
MTGSAAAAFPSRRVISPYTTGHAGSYRRIIESTHFGKFQRNKYTLFFRNTLFGLENLYFRGNQ